MTGVQTCALPISALRLVERRLQARIQVVVVDLGLDLLGVGNGKCSRTAWEDAEFAAALARGMEQACRAGRFPLVNGETAELAHRVPGPGSCRLNWNSVALALVNSEKEYRASNLRPGQPIVALREFTRTRKLLVRERIELLVDRDTPLLELSPLAAWGTGDPVGAGMVCAIGVVSGVECVLNGTDMTVVRKGVLATGQTAAVVAQQGLCAGIGFEHALRARVDQQHRLAGGVKQDAVARLDVAQAQVVALHRLLGLDQAALQIGDALEVARQRHAFATAAQGQHDVLQRHVLPTGAGVIDVAPARRLAFLRLGQIGRAHV